MTHSSADERSMSERVPQSDDTEPKPLGNESPEIIEAAAEIGERRLNRSTVGDAVTAFIGGLSLSFGAVAMGATGAAFGGGDVGSVAQFVGALAYPIGLVIALVGKAELFTENFFLPISGIISGDGTITKLLALWGTSLVFNLVGCAVFALLVAQGNALDDATAEELRQIGQHIVEYPILTAFIKAIFAGWLMTLLTWLLLAAPSFGARLVMIWMIGFLLVIGRFGHVIIASSEVFMAYALGAPVTLQGWFLHTLVPATIGNILGGVVFVTLLHYIQAQYSDTQREHPFRR